ALRPAGGPGRPGAAVPPMRDLRAAGGDRRPAGRGGHRRASRDRWGVAEGVPRLAHGPRPESSRGGGRSRVEAESGLHAAARNHGAGECREALTARIEAADVAAPVGRYALAGWLFA